MPQDQNSGGFYLALFRKSESENLKQEIETVEDIKEESEEANDELNELLGVEEIGESKINVKESEVKQKKKNNYHTNSETSFIPLPESLWLDLKAEFGINDQFPKHLLYVASERYKAIYYVTPKVANYFKNDTRSSLKLIIYGTVLFSKSRIEANTPNSYRISQSGIRYLKPHMTKNLISIDFEELKFFLRCNGSVSNEDLLKENSISGERFTKLSKNSYCLVYKNDAENFEEELFMVSKMEHSIVIMVPKEDIAGFKIKYKIE